MGITAKGADIGIPMILPHIHFVWYAYFAFPPKYRRLSITASSLIKELGNSSRTASLLFTLLGFLPAVKGGILFNPHSS